MVRTFLETPPVPCLVPESVPGVFDAYGWCESDVLEWRRPSGQIDLSTPIRGADPARMVFVFHPAATGEGESNRCPPLPRELARLHAFGLGLADEEALAPYAIDDATDGLFAHRVRPRDILWLAADNLNALVWGLHDWAHFHNHGPFQARAWTELQCDAAALVWLWRNRERIGIDVERLARVREEIEELARARFEEEGSRYDPEPLAQLLSSMGGSHAR